MPRTTPRDFDGGHWWLKAHACRVFKRPRETFPNQRFPPDIAARALRKLTYVDLATHRDDLKVPPGNALPALKQDRHGQHAIRINDQWRICFRFVDGDAFDVEGCGYH